MIEDPEPHSLDDSDSQSTIEYATAIECSSGDSFITSCVQLESGHSTNQRPLFRKGEDLLHSSSAPRFSSPLVPFLPGYLLRELCSFNLIAHQARNALLESALPQTSPATLYYPSIRRCRSVGGAIQPPGILDLRESFVRNASSEASGGNSASPPPITSDTEDISAKGAFNDASPLMREVLAVGDDVVSTYEALRQQHPPEDFELVQHSAFRSCTPQELGQYFSAAADVNNALHFRKSIIAVAIGEALEALHSKLSLFETDRVLIETVQEEMKQIKEECSARNLKLNFYALENMRAMLPKYAGSLSVYERHAPLLCSVNQVLEDKRRAQMAAEQFIEDPLALKERRLPLFGTSRR